MSPNSVDLPIVDGISGSWNNDCDRWFESVSMFDTTETPPPPENVNQERDMAELDTAMVNHDSNRIKNAKDAHTLRLSNLAAAAAETLPLAVDIQDYDKVLDKLTSHPSGPAVNEIIARQPLDSLPVFHGFNVPQHGQQYSHNTARFDSANVDPRLRVFSDSHPELTGPQRKRATGSLADTLSIASSQQIGSEAVFSVSSQTSELTPTTSLQLSRQWTNSNLNTLSTPLQDPHDNDTTCHHCGKKFDTPSACRKHKKSHFKKRYRQHACEHCPPDVGRVDFNDKRDLRRHVFKEHRKHFTGKLLEAWNSVNCEACGKNCSRGDGLKRHLKKNAPTCGAYYKQMSAVVAGSSSTSSLAMVPNVDMAAQVDSAAMIVIVPKEKGRPPLLCPAMGDMNSGNPPRPFSSPGTSQKNHQDTLDWY